MPAPTPEPDARPPHVLRLGTYNVEWFNDLFNGDDELIEDGGWSGRYNVTRAEQANAVAHVLKSMDADAMLIVEAPDHSYHRSTVAALEGFARRFDLRCREALIGFSNDTRQEIALLYDPDALRARHVARTDGAPRFDQTFRLDVDVDSYPDPIVWSKPPLELELTLPGGAVLSMIGVHAKSKAPHGAKSGSEETRIAISNRRKQLAQCIWLRRRVEAQLAEGGSLIVLGDFNDGPGLDGYEKLFGRSGVEIVLGEGDGAQLFDPHAVQGMDLRLGSVTQTTARFYNSQSKRYLSALLDYIMVSPDLRALDPVWRIWHPFEDPRCFADEALKAALLAASDHFPVTLDLDVSRLGEGASE